jgi:cardiolipin synthase
MKCRLLVDSSEFWQSLQEDIRTAQQSIYLQSLSFEGDGVGLEVARALTSACAPDRRVIVDEFYTRHRINDKYLHNPKHWFNTEIRAERDRTLSMLADLEKAGVKTRLTSASRPLTLRFLERNHKKIMAIDNRVAYIGGMNFSDHNFAWHDLMLRIENEDIARTLALDFTATWNGSDLHWKKAFDDIEIHSFDGITNGDAFVPILDLIGGARSSIQIVSPYITYPFFARLEQARRNGAKVTLVTPERNNWHMIREYVQWECARRDIAVMMYQPRMSHLKAMLIDDRILILGSSNFDFLSWTFMQEIVAVITDEHLIAQFKTRVLQKDLDASVPAHAHVADWKGYYHIARLKTMSVLFGSLSKVLYPRR